MLEPAADILAGDQGIPISPLVGARLLDASIEAGAAFQDVVRIVQTDQALTLRILKIVNSPFYGLRGKVSTLSHAVAMLGPNALQILVRESDAREYPTLPTEVEVIDKYFFWQHAITTATIAQALAKRVGYDIPEEAYLAGLLHDMGKLSLELHDPAGYAAVARDMLKNEDPLPTIEMRRFGITHAELGGHIAARWNLPTTLEEAIRYHHTPADELAACDVSDKGRELAAITTYADFIAWSQGLGSIENGHVPVHNHPPREIINVLSSDLESIMDEVNSRLKEIGAIFDLKTSGIYDFGDVFRRHHPRTTARRDANAGREPKVRSFSALNELVREIRRLEREDRIFTTMLSSLHETLGFDRVLYLGLNRANNEVVGQRRVDCTEIPIDTGKISFVLGIDEEGISRALMTQRPVLLKRNTLDAKVVDLLGVREALVAPIIVNDRAQGVVIADHALSGRTPTREQTEALGFVCLETGLAIENRQLIDRSKQLQELAEKDELTGVNNRRCTMQLGRRHLEHANATEAPLSVVMFDIDHFKRFNDTHGHQAGDFVLKEVAKRVEGVSRKVDVIGRYGGEEFMVVLPDTPLERAIRYAERLRQVVEDYGKEIQKLFPECRLSISLGIAAIHHPNEESLEHLIERADKRLYSAKARGRNRACHDQ